MSPTLPHERLTRRTRGTSVTNLPKSEKAESSKYNARDNGTWHVSAVEIQPAALRQQTTRLQDMFDPL